MSNNLAEMPDKYFSRTMRRHIERSSEVGKSDFGLGLIARRNCPVNTIVGYYSGPVLTWNNVDRYHDQDDYIAGGLFTHPQSGKRMSYHVVVFGPTRFMNHGQCPDYFQRRAPSHNSVANVRMQSEKMLKIGRVYRPVWEFRTIRRVRRGEELLYDYGVHQDEIYYEVLRRNKVYDSAVERRKFNRKLMALEHRSLEPWARACADSWRSREEKIECFYHELLIRFLNASDSLKFPEIQ